VAAVGRSDVARLLGDPWIIRQRGKIDSTVTNAMRAGALERGFGSLASYFARYRPAPPSRPRRLSWSALRRLSTSPEATALSRDLKARGWTFVGPTTLYAFMQAMGLVNDHLGGCGARHRVETALRRSRS